MGVPKYIREVPRPTNTVVIDNGKDGPTRYAVRERSGVQYISGGNPQPKNGKLMGYTFQNKRQFWMRCQTCCHMVQLPLYIQYLRI